MNIHIWMKHKNGAIVQTDAVEFADVLEKSGYERITRKEYRELKRKLRIPAIYAKAKMRVKTK